MITVRKVTEPSTILILDQEQLERLFGVVEDWIFDDDTYDLLADRLEFGDSSHTIILSNDQNLVRLQDAIKSATGPRGEYDQKGDLYEKILLPILNS